MPNYEPYLGYQQLPGTTQAPITDISGIERPHAEIATDPDLPVVSTLYLNTGAVEYVVIPKFRVVGMKKTTLVDFTSGSATTNTAGNKAVITTAGPAATDADPMGVAVHDLYKEFANRPQQEQSVFLRQRLITFPFINGPAGTYTTGNTPATLRYNSNLNGTLYEGAPVAPDAYGRPVLYVPKATYTAMDIVSGSTPAASVTFSNAKSAYVPYAIKAYNITDGVEITLDYTEGNCTLTWSASTGLTVAVTGETASDIVLFVLEYGHDPIKCFGQAIEYKIGKNLTSLAGWLRRPNVPTTYPGAMMANFMYVQNIQAVFTIEADGTAAVVDALNSNAALGNATVTISSSSKVVEVALPFKYIDPTRYIKVEYAADGSTYATLANASLERQIPDTHFGPAFAISPASGTLMLYLVDEDTLIANTSKVRLTCSIELGQPRQTLGFMGNNGGGIEGLTDGSITPLAGVKLAAALHPDGADLLRSNGATDDIVAASGLMHIIVY